MTAWGEEEGVGLSWRGCPSETLADTIIRVSGEDTMGESPVEYNVHRTVIAVSYRRSLLIHNLLIDGAPEDEHHRMKESLSLSLPTACVRVFPLALDFMYNQPIQLDRDNVLPLLRLAGELMMRELFLEAGEHFAGSITMPTAPGYLMEAVQLELDTVVATTLALLAGNFEAYAGDDGGSLGGSFDRLPFGLVVDVLRQERLAAAWETTSHWTKRYLKQHRDSPGFTAASFEALTSQLGRVHREDCMYLLQCASGYGSQRVLELCLGEVAAIFEHIPLAEICLLDLDVMEHLLERVDLRVHHEDFIFRCVRQYIQAHPDLSPPQIAALWLRCHFAQLSPDCLAEACHTTGIPLYALTEGSVAKLLAESEEGTVSAYQEYIAKVGASHGGVARFQPRQDAAHIASATTRASRPGS